MRLWHIDLIPYLSIRHLLGQHRECCALRGRGWGKKHSVVDYVFTHDVKYLINYHMHVMLEMQKRGYNSDILWWCPEYRGKKCHAFDDLNYDISKDRTLIYPEHNYIYLTYCIELLLSKNPEEYNHKFLKERKV